MKYLKLNTFLFIALAVFAVKGHSQCIEGQLHSNHCKKIYLGKTQGRSIVLVDSVEITNDRFVFEHQPFYPPGLYKLILSDTDPHTHQPLLPVNLVLNDKDVAVEWNILAPGQTLKFKNSIENNIFQSYLKQAQTTREKIYTLNKVMSWYSEDSTKNHLTDMLELEIKSLDAKLGRDMLDLSDKYPNTFVAKLLYSASTPTLNDYPYSRLKDENSFLRNHFFDKIDFTQDWLLRTSILPNKYSAFLDRFEMIKINECIEAVDIILEKSVQNDDIYHYTLEFLLDYFEKSHNQDAIAYLNDQYMESGCKNKELAMELANKKKMLENLSVGHLAPPISLNDPSGQVKHLNTVNARLTLVYFWDSQCPHCIDAIHQLQTLYQSYKSDRLDFFAVSLDKQKENWTETLDKYEMPWNHVCTKTKNRKTIMQTYNIKSIPMYYLLDQDKRILLKSQSLQSIKLNINKIFRSDT